MKVLMYNFNPHDIPGTLPSWFKHDEFADIELSQIQELFDAGANVLMKPDRLVRDGLKVVVLCVDGKWCFKQH